MMSIGDDNNDEEDELNLGLAASESNSKLALL